MGLSLLHFSASPELKMVLDTALKYCTFLLITKVSVFKHYCSSFMWLIKCLFLKAVKIKTMITVWYKWNGSFNLKSILTYFCDNNKCSCDMFICYPLHKYANLQYCKCKTAKTTTQQHNMQWFALWKFTQQGAYQWRHL